MPELAAHLERELAELNQRLDGSNRCETCGHWRNDHAMDLVGEHFCEHEGGSCGCNSYVGVTPPSYAELVTALRGVAAALAACAREARLNVHANALHDYHASHGTLDLEKYHRAALERAVGEKGQ